MMLDIIDEVAWELNCLSKNLKNENRELSVQLSDYSYRLSEIHNEFCHLEEEQ